MLGTEPISHNTGQEESQHSVDGTWPCVRITVLGAPDAWGNPMRNLDEEIKVKMGETHLKQRPEAISAAPTDSRGGIS